MAVTLGTVVSAVHGGSYPTNGTLTGVDCTGASSLVVIMYTNTTLQGPDFTIRFGSTDLQLVESYQNTTAGYGEILIYQHPGTPAGVANVTYFQSQDTYNADRMVVAIPVFGTGGYALIPGVTTYFQTSNGVSTTMMGIGIVPPVGSAIISGVFHYYPTNPPSNASSTYGFAGWSTAFSETASQPIKALGLAKTTTVEDQTDTFSAINHDAFNYVTAFSILMAPTEGGGDPGGGTTTPVGASLDAGWSVSGSASMAYGEILESQPLSTAAPADVLSLTFAAIAGKKYFLLATAAVTPGGVETAPTDFQIVNAVNSVLGHSSRAAPITGRTESHVTSAVWTAAATGNATMRVRAKAGVASTTISGVRFAIFQAGANDVFVAKDTAVQTTSGVFVTDLQTTVPVAGNYLIVATSAYTNEASGTFASARLSVGGSTYGDTAGMSDGLTTSRVPYGFAMVRSMTAGQAIELQHVRTTGAGSVQIRDQRIAAIYLPDWAASGNTYNAANSSLTLAVNTYQNITSGSLSITATGSKPILALWGAAGVTSTTNGGIRLALTDSGGVIQEPAVRTYTLASSRRVNVFQMTRIPATAGSVTRKLMGARDQTTTANWDEANLTLLEPAVDLTVVIPGRQKTKPAGALAASKTGQYTGLKALYAFNSSQNLANAADATDVLTLVGGSTADDAVGTHYIAPASGEAATPTKTFADYGVTGTASPFTLFVRCGPNLFSDGTDRSLVAIGQPGTTGVCLGSYGDIWQGFSDDDWMDFGNRTNQGPVQTLVATWDGSNFAVYVNGALRVANATYNASLSATGKLSVGWQPSASTPIANWQQRIYEVGFLAGAWTPAEVAAYDDDPVAMLTAAPTAVGASLTLASAIRTSASGSTSLPWAIRSAVPGSLNAAWAGKAAMYRSLNAIWHDRATVSGALDAPSAVRLTATGTTDLPWSVKGAAGNSLAAGWTGKSAAGSAADLPWAGLTAVSGSLTSVSDVRQTVSAAADLPASVRGVATSDLSAGWDIEAKGSIAAGLDAGYAIRGTVSAAVDLPAAIRGTAAQGVDLPAAIRNTVFGAGDFPAAVRNTQAGAIDAAWVVRARVSQGSDAPWAIRGSAAQGLDAGYAVRVRTTQDADLGWEILAPLGRVGSSLGAGYDVRNTQNQAVDAAWGIRSNTAQAVDARWSVRNAAGRTLETPWDGREIITAGLDGPWNIRSSAGRNTDLPWAGRQIAGQTSSLPWDQREVAAGVIDLASGVRGLADRTVTLPWSLASLGDGLTRTVVRLSGRGPAGVRLTGVQPAAAATRLTGSGLNIRLNGKGRT